ncbi:MAG: sulfatase-like hydrolase/transferase [Bacteroidota bacterium]|nr:sulfatase-like hydrolase/transferase [Bacteroidota bacterium]
MAKKTSRKQHGFSGNVLVITLIRVLVVLALFFLSRLLFYLFNLHYFSDLSFAQLLRILFVGIRFDIAAVFILNVPFILMNSLPFRFRYNKTYQGITRGYFYTANTIGLLANFIDIIYFRFTLKRMTGDIFNYLSVGGDFNKLIPQFLKDFWYIAIVFFIFTFALIWLSYKVKLNPAPKKIKRLAYRYYMSQSFLFLVVIFFTIVGIRGGFQLRPISIITAGNYVSAKDVPLVLNTPFSVAKTIGHETLSEKAYFRSERSLEKIYNPVHKGVSTGFHPVNVMVIILESFSLEHFGSMNKSLENGHYEGFTPFLDSLINQGMFFKAFANGKTSIQGIPAVLSGIPSLMYESYIQSNYSTDKVSSLAGLLKTKGYVSAFYHGGTNGTMGFDVYTKYSGFDHYFGRSEYNNEKDYDGKWGIRDEEFFQFTAKSINQLHEPFLAALFSLSSHHPYFVPAKYQPFLRKGKLPIQQSIMYADYSLKKFFETAEKMPWFDRTLFVITADHTSEGYYPYYQTSAGQFAVPLLFYRHNSDIHGEPSSIAQQTDIMPSVLSYLGYDKDYVAFGNNVFDTTCNRFSIHFISGIYGLIKDGYLLEYDGLHSTGLYDLHNDSLQKNNLINKRSDVRNRLELFIKAYLQQYNNRIIENRLTAD